MDEKWNVWEQWLEENVFKIHEKQEDWTELWREWDFYLHIRAEPRIKTSELNKYGSIFYQKTTSLNDVIIRSPYEEKPIVGNTITNNFIISPYLFTSNTIKMKITINNKPIKLRP